MKLIKFIQRKYIFAILYSVIMIVSAIFVILDALVFSKNIVVVEANEFNEEEYNSLDKVITENSYKDDNIDIKISHERYLDSDVYIADVKINNIKYFKSAFAENKYGRNVIEITSDTAKRNNAIFAVNGDYYGFRDEGFVVRNGVMYRDIPRSNGKDGCLLVYEDGQIDIVYERKTNLKNLIDEAKTNNNSILQAYTFGPGLVANGKKIYSNESLEEKDLCENPRTAVGMIEPLHYIFVCIDGRHETSKGVTIDELADYMLKKECKVAYNLDGGNSTTMYFNGKVINTPVHIAERQVSDIVYIGY